MKAQLISVFSGSSLLRKTTPNYVLLIVFTTAIINTFLIQNYFASEDFVRFWDYRDHIVNVQKLAADLRAADFGSFISQWALSSGSGYPPTFLLPAILVGTFVTVTPLIFATVMSIFYFSATGLVFYKISELLDFQKYLGFLIVVIGSLNPVSLNILAEGFPDGAFIFFVVLSVYFCLKFTLSFKVEDLAVALTVIASLPFIRKTYIYFSASLLITIIFIAFLQFARFRSQNDVFGFEWIKRTSKSWIWLGTSCALGWQLIPSFFGWDKESINSVFGISANGLIYGLIEMNGYLPFILILVSLVLNITRIILRRNIYPVSVYTFLYVSYSIYVWMKLEISGVSTQHVLVQYTPVFALITSILILNEVDLKWPNGFQYVHKPLIIFALCVYIIGAIRFFSPSLSNFEKEINQTRILPAWAPPTIEKNTKRWYELACKLTDSAAIKYGETKVISLNSSFEVNDGKLVSAINDAQCKKPSSFEISRSFLASTGATFVSLDGRHRISIPQISNFDRLGGEIFSGYQSADFIVMSSPNFLNFDTSKQVFLEFLWSYARSEIESGSLKVVDRFEVGASSRQGFSRITLGRSKISSNDVLLLVRKQPLNAIDFKTAVTEFLSNSDVQLSRNQSKNIPISYQSDIFKFPSALKSNWESSLASNTSHISYGAFSLIESQVVLDIMSTCEIRFESRTKNGTSTQLILGNTSLSLNVKGYYSFNTSSQFRQCAVSVSMR